MIVRLQIQVGAMTVRGGMKRASYLFKSSNAMRFYYFSLLSGYIDLKPIHIDCSGRLPSESKALILVVKEGPPH